MFMVLNFFASSSSYYYYFKCKYGLSIGFCVRTGESSS